MLDDTDRRMIALAANRGPVLVLTDSDREVPATLIAWRPRRQRDRATGTPSTVARVQFTTTGSQALVDTWRVRPWPTSNLGMPTTSQEETSQ